MARFSSPLNQIRIAAPCSADWDQMIGNDRVRFCGQCQLNVYNLSELSKQEAEEFVTGNEGRLCVRYYQRADGSILTRNCPIGVRAIRRRLSRAAQAVSAAVFSFLAGIGFYAFVRWPIFRPQPVMGAIARPPVPIQPVKIQERTVGSFVVMGGITISPPSVHLVKSPRK